MKLKKFRLLFLLPLLALFTVTGVSAANSSSAANSLSAATGIPTTIGVEQIVKIPTVPEQLIFVGERVPLQYSDVREALQREMVIITYWHASLTSILLLNNRYEAAIKKILKEEGILEDFYYLCIAESGLMPVISPAGACGYWQFLPSTAKEFGLVVNEEVDERYNIEKSTRAAAAYFRKVHQELGTWTMAAASFNIGLSNVLYRMEIQSQKNFYDTQFPEETARYIFRALAFKIIMANPEAYGYKIEKEQLYEPLKYKDVIVNGPVENWSVFAAKYNTNFKILKIYNQWIRANMMENKEGRLYNVKIPLEGTR